MHIGEVGRDGSKRGASRRWARRCRGGSSGGKDVDVAAWQISPGVSGAAAVGRCNGKYVNGWFAGRGRGRDMRQLQRGQWHGCRQQPWGRQRGCGGGRGGRWGCPAGSRGGGCVGDAGWGHAWVQLGQGYSGRSASDGLGCSKGGNRVERS